MDHINNSLFLLKLPYEIRLHLDRNFYCDLISLLLIPFLSVNYPAIAFEVFYSIFQKTYTCGWINLAEVAKLLSDKVPNGINYLIIKEVEKAILMDYLGQLTNEMKLDVKNQLETKINHLNTSKHHTNGTKYTLLSVVPKTVIVKVNRQECYDFVLNELPDSFNNDQRDILTLRVTQNIFRDVEVDDVDFKLLAQKLYDDLNSDAFRFCQKLQNFVLSYDK